MRNAEVLALRSLREGFPPRSPARIREKGCLGVHPSGVGGLECRLMMHLKHGILAALLLFLVLPGPSLARTSSGAPCRAWAGEPTPLPTLADPHRARAEWAKVRVEELSRLARVLEDVDPMEAHRFWKHASCIAPEDEKVSAQLARSTPLTVHHALAQGVGTPGRTSLDRASSVDGALLIALTQPNLSSAPAPQPVAARLVRKAPPAPPPPVSAPPPERVRSKPVLGLNHVDEVLDVLAGMIQEARFRSALEMMTSVREAVREIPAGADQRLRFARVELLAGTAQVALGQNDVAREHFRQALKANPALELGGDQPPKVRRVFSEVKAES